MLLMQRYKKQNMGKIVQTNHAQKHGGSLVAKVAYLCQYGGGGQNPEKGCEQKGKNY